MAAQSGGTCGLMLHYIIGPTGSIMNMMMMMTINKLESIFCAQFESRTKTKVTKSQPEIIKISEFKNVLKFGHGSGNSK